MPGVGGLDEAAGHAKAVGAVVALISSIWGLLTIISTTADSAYDPVTTALIFLTNGVVIFGGGLLVFLGVFLIARRHILERTGDPSPLVVLAVGVAAAALCVPWTIEISIDDVSRRTANEFLLWFMRFCGGFTVAALGYAVYDTFVNRDSS